MYRWIERYNNKLRQPAKKEEARRMKQFVNDAFAQDPRILQRRAEEKAHRCTPKLACHSTALPSLSFLQRSLCCVCVGSMPVSGCA
jgi:aminoglycoside phosphotransferase family enzyme